jgi:hypothetical protein
MLHWSTLEGSKLKVPTDADVSLLPLVVNQNNPFASGNVDKISWSLPIAGGRFAQV